MPVLHAGAGLAPFGILGWPQTSDGTPLVARCLVLDNGAVRVVVCSVTCLALVPDVSLAIRTAVAVAAGVPLSAVFLAATHVHSGPSTLTDDRAARRVLSSISRRINKTY